MFRNIKVFSIIYQQISLNKNHTYFFSTKKNLYEILEIKNGASQDEIKKAYFIKAKLYHPDKNGSSNAKEKFAEINNAYEILTNQSKKNQYDMNFNEDQFGQGIDPLNQRMKSKNNSFNEEFDEFSFHRQKTQKGSDITISLDIQFMEAIKGCQKTVVYPKIGVCLICKGYKCKPGTHPSPCPSCKGNGQISQKLGPTLTKFLCTNCNGEGKFIKQKCTLCEGQGVYKEEIRETLQVPKGVDHNQLLRKVAKGNLNMQGDDPGDLIIQINLKPDNYFQRVGNDIFSYVQLTVSQAVLGHKVNIRTLQGNQDVIIKEGAYHGQQIILKNQGISKVDQQDQIGDHILVVEIMIPKYLSSDQKAIYKKIAQFGKREQFQKQQLNQDMI